MTDQQEDLRQKVALFRYGVIADLVSLEPGEKGIYAKLEEKASKTYDIPGSRKRMVATETIRGWLKAYRKKGFDGLLPKPRRDIGESHSIPKEVQDLLLTIKEDNPDYSVSIVIDEARTIGSIDPDVALPPSTVYRLLARHGLMRKAIDEDSKKDRRRFSFEKAGELWMSDVMHGPAVLVKRKKRKAYLIAFIDDATRVVPHATFALSESSRDFLPALKQAFLRRGIPKRLFVDHGSAFRSHHLALVMAKLGVTLIHARARHPQAKGKIERWFRTVRTRLLVRLGEEDLSSLDALNRRLWSWVEAEYHHSPHRGLDDETPLDRWSQAGDRVRYADDLDLDDLFLFEARRKVRKDRTVSLDGVDYEVEASLVDEKVTLRFDPKIRSTVQVVFEGRRFGDAKPVDVHANCFVKREKEKPGVKLSDLADDQEVR
jgi:putative transposase